MNKLETSPNSKEKQKISLAPKVVYGIRSDISNNIQYFAWDKCGYVAGNYAIIYLIREKIQYFFPAHPDYGEITSFGVDEYLDTILLVIAQKPQFLYVRFINKLTLCEIESKFIDVSEPDGFEYFLSISVNATRGYIAGLVGPKTPSTVKIFQEELRVGRKWTTAIKMIGQTTYKSILINNSNPFYMAIYGKGGFTILQISELDKKTVTKLEVDPRSQSFQEFSTFLYTFVSCTWISKTRIAFLNSLCDVFVIEFYNKQKLDNVYKRAIKSINIFETQSRGKGIFTKNGNLFICKDDGMIVKLEDKQQSEKTMIYEKVQRNTKFVQNLPRMDVHSLSLSNSQQASSNFHAIILSSVSGQIYYIDITNENSLSDGSNYKFLQCSFHSDEITCLDVSKIKPLLVTCSKDKYICIWNYISMTLELSEVFDEEPLQVAFHPNGLHIAVMFKEKFSLMDILERKLNTYKEVTIFSPCEIKFSHCGNLFSVCYKNCFQIYNFYTLEIILSSKSAEGIQLHTDEVKCLSWDEEGTGFATCGIDGRAFYWKLFRNTVETILIDFNSRVYRFLQCEVYTDKDTNMKKILLLDENFILEVEQIFVNETEEDKIKNPQDYLDSTNSNTIIKPKILFTHPKFSQIKFDIETRLIITSSLEEHCPTLFISTYPFVLDKKEVTSFQANSQGVKCLKTSSDMKFLFTSGKDKCLFFFEIVSSNKYVRKDDSLMTHDLTLIKKVEYDTEFQELKKILDRYDKDINEEIESYEIKGNEIENEIDICILDEYKEKVKNVKERQELEYQKNEKISEFESELKEMLVNKLERLQELEFEHVKNRNAKTKDREKENDLLKNEKNKDEALLRNLRRANEQEFLKLKENYNKIICNFNDEINILELNCEEVSNCIEKDKSDHIETNDNQISIKRVQLEDLKRNYDQFKTDHGKDEDKLKNEIRELKSIIKFEEAKKVEGKNNLSMIYTDNAKLTKIILELQTDKKEKEETIIEKNSAKREMERENQELEKFKFVLNYKIKELKQEKDPKENKLSTLESQARSMEREIKNFEFSQANYIVDLSSNHELMKLHERQIYQTERIIEKLQNYKKLFQHSLYESMEKVKNHKELKKELIKLKELYLDKEFIDQIDKPMDSNFEFQRNFLESAISDYKSKLEVGRNFLSQDFNKIMNENRKLLTIVNELEQEKKEVSNPPLYLSNVSKSISFTKPKISIKNTLPMISSNRDRSIKDKLMLLKKEYFEVEKKLLFKSEMKKKAEAKNEKKKA